MYRMTLAGYRKESESARETKGNVGKSTYYMRIFHPKSTDQSIHSAGYISVLELGRSISEKRWLDIADFVICENTTEDVGTCA